jgi:hypothetical protein
MELPPVGSVVSQNNWDMESLDGKEENQDPSLRKLPQNVDPAGSRY